MHRPPFPRLLLYLLTATLLCAVVIAASTSGAAFGAYNPAWDGTAEFRDTVATHSDATVSINKKVYATDQANQTMAVVLAPETPYAPKDLIPIRRFVENGGTLLVADNFGPTTGEPPYGNTLLTSVGATARFDGALLRDERNYYRAPTLPVAQPVTDHPYTTGVSDVTLNYGTAVVPNEAETLIRTSAFAYRDVDRSGSLSGSEELARYSVVTVETVGNGEVIAVSDPSIFINAMLNREGNTAFVDALAQAHEQVIFDYSQAGTQPPISVALLILKGTPLLQALVCTLGVALGWGVIAQPSHLTRIRDRLGAVVPLIQSGSDTQSTRVTQQITPTESEFLAYLRTEYPEWDDERLRRIVADIIADEPATTDDE